MFKPVFLSALGLIFTQNLAAQIQGRCFVDAARAMVLCPGEPGTNASAWLSEAIGEEVRVTNASIDAPFGGSVGSTQLNGEVVFVYSTPFPIVSIESSAEIVDEPKVATVITIVDGTAEPIVSAAGVEFRGFSAQAYDKKNFDVELWEDATGDKTVKVAVAGMREDDDWVLDAMANEPWKLRAVVAQRLWNDMTTLPYAEREPEARPGAALEYVEVGLDGDYRGLYTLGEQVDRKLLKLKKPPKSDTEDVTTGNGGRPPLDERGGGQLFKASFHSPATSWKSAPPIDTASEDYYRFEQKFPSRKDGAQYEGLRDIVEWVTTVDQETFNAGARERLAVENIVDYFIFANAVFGRDNFGTNYYLARYDIDEPWFLIPWDLDATFGVAWNGSFTSNSGLLYFNALFDKIFANPEMLDQARERYAVLRNGELAADEMIGRFVSISEEIRASGAVTREAARWPKISGNALGNLGPTYQFVRDRLAVLDVFFSYVPGTSSTSDLKNSISLGPNPASSQLTVFGLPTAAPGTLLNAAGQVVLRQELAAGTTTLDVAALPRGLYLLRIGDATQTVVLR